DRCQHGRAATEKPGGVAGWALCALPPLRYPRATTGVTSNGGRALTKDISDVDLASRPDKDLVRLMWQEARDLLKRLEGSAVRRMSVQAGKYKVEIELGGFAESAIPRAAPGAAGGEPARAAV